MNLSLECTRLTEKIKDIEEKLDKERKNVLYWKWKMPEHLMR
ncbi:hypothetical protein PL321_12900 [Caloramator sp. mosi_1]|nr:hypothetical protein [Caloramator sp. mosi_1]WDC83565.1 hypothetical protein PL321_12900 [Caloramator sp. mosi_1]